MSTSFQDIDIREVVAAAEIEADRITEATSSLRVTFNAGRPNSSEESTNEGVLLAVRDFLNDFPFPVA